MADRLGLDLVLSWMEQMHKAGDQFVPLPLLRRYVREKRLGVKTNLGFFRYNTEAKQEIKE